MIAITQSNFKSEVLDFQGKVLVDFWAPWCGPCQMLTPIMEELSSQVKVVKVNVDEEPQLAVEFSINSIPAVLFFDHGQLKNSLIGFHQKAEYLNLLS